MQINLNNLVSISEANQNFSKVARLVDTKGTAVILKNNQPKYVLVDYQTLVNEQEATSVSADELDAVATAILSKHLDAFKELAK